MSLSAVVQDEESPVASDSSPTYDVSSKTTKSAGISTSAGYQSPSSSSGVSDDEENSLQRGDECAPRSASSATSLKRKPGKSQGKQEKPRKQWSLKDEQSASNTPAQKRRKIAKLKEADTLSSSVLLARQEEEERRRRLGELAVQASSDAAATEKTRQPLVVDCRSKKSASQCTIILDSDSEDDEPTSSLASSGSAPPCADGGAALAPMVSKARTNVVEIISDDEDELPSGDGLASTSDVVTFTADGNILVNPEHPKEEADICLPPQVARVIKKHQVEGIRFMFDNIVERVAEYRRNRGFGCILAHSMGLGKTLQVVSFIDTFLRHTPGKRVLCIVPINTLQNWVAEFNKWIPPPPPGSTAAATATSTTSSATAHRWEEGDATRSEDNGGKSTQKAGDQHVRYREFHIFCLNENDKSLSSRAAKIAEWHRKGGVLLIGYELFRILALLKPSIAGRKKLTQLESGRAKKKKVASTGAAAVAHGGYASGGGGVAAKAAVETSEYVVIDIDEEDRQTDLLKSLQAALCNPGADLVVCDEGHRIKNNAAAVSQALHEVRTRRRIVMTGYPLQNNLTEYWCMVDFVRPNYLGTQKDFMNMFERPILNGQCIDSTKQDVKLMRCRSHVLHSLLEGFVQRRDQRVLMKTLPELHEWVLFSRMSPVQATLYSTLADLLQSDSNQVNPIRAFSMCCKIWNHPDVLHTCVSGGNASKSNILDDMDVDPPVAAANKGKKEPSFVATWAPTLLKAFGEDYQTFDERNGGKFEILLQIIHLSVLAGDKLLVFSQSLSTLSLLEDFLAKVNVPGTGQRWRRNQSYFRLDGSTATYERERMTTAFNCPRNDCVMLFLLSTRAGSLGINLIGANRVVIVDVSWNPCHDAQAICRVYRYGQTKKCFVYRLVCDNTLEKKIYERQVLKQGMSSRIVDELHPERNGTRDVMNSLFHSKDDSTEDEPDYRSIMAGYSDFVLTTLLVQYGAKWLTKAPFEHSSLLAEDKDEVKLTAQEKKQALQNYENEKSGIRQGLPMFNPFVLPHLSGQAPQNVAPKPQPSIQEKMAKLMQYPPSRLHPQLQDSILVRIPDGEICIQQVQWLTVLKYVQSGIGNTDDKAAAASGSAKSNTASVQSRGMPSFDSNTSLAMPSSHSESPMSTASGGLPSPTSSSSSGISQAYRDLSRSSAPGAEDASSTVQAPASSSAKDVSAVQGSAAVRVPSKNPNRDNSVAVASSSLGGTVETPGKSPTEHGAIAAASGHVEGAVGAPRSRGSGPFLDPSSAEYALALSRNDLAGLEERLAAEHALTRSQLVTAQVLVSKLESYHREQQAQKDLQQEQEERRQQLLHMQQYQHRFRSHTAPSTQNSAKQTQGFLPLTTSKTPASTVAAQTSVTTERPRAACNDSASVSSTSSSSATPGPIRPAVLTGSRSATPPKTDSISSSRSSNGAEECSDDDGDLEIVFSKPASAATGNLAAAASPPPMGSLPATHLVHPAGPAATNCSNVAMLPAPHAHLPFQQQQQRRRRRKQSPSAFVHSAVQRPIAPHHPAFPGHGNYPAPVGSHGGSNAPRATGFMRGQTPAPRSAQPLSSGGSNLQVPTQPSFAGHSRMPAPGMIRSLLRPHAVASADHSREPLLATPNGPRSHPQRYSLPPASMMNDQLHASAPLSTSSTVSYPPRHGLQGTAVTSSGPAAGHNSSILAGLLQTPTVQSTVLGGSLPSAPDIGTTTAAAPAPASGATGRGVIKQHTVPRTPGQTEKIDFIEIL